MQSKQILLTFDYEPYLGSKSGHALDCLLKPTEELRQILSRFQAKAVFFIDTLFLQKLKQTSELKPDFEKVKQQLQLLYNEGHYIYPHIHPHWLDAEYIPKEKQFNLSNLTKYSLAVLDDRTVSALFAQSISLLQEIGISYSEWGYRAGGWCIQPFERYENIFKDYSIVYEFSVLPGYKNQSSNQLFDYTSFTNTTPYKFLNNIETPIDNGPFTEFPISTLSLSKRTIFFDRILRKYLWKINDRGYGKGISAKTAALKVNQSQKEMISIELLNRAKLTTYKQYISANNYMHWISHPKMFNKHGLRSFARFMEHLQTHYTVQYDHTKMLN